MVGTLPVWQTIISVVLMIAAFIPGARLVLPGMANSGVPEPPPLWSGETPLSYEQARTIFTVAGWDGQSLDEALAVACGFDNPRFPSGESNCRPEAVGDGGRALGLFQLWPVWIAYCGITPEGALHPLTNASCALEVYRYDLAAGNSAWAQWSVKPR